MEGLRDPGRSFTDRKASLDMGHKEKLSFKFVFIPADVNEPIEEWEQSYGEGDEVECLLNRIKVKRQDFELSLLRF